jgi:HEAT repeat protein
VLEATSGYEQIEVCEACLALAANLARAGAQAEAARAYSGVWQALPAEGYTHLVHAVVEGLAPAVGDQPTSELVKRTSDNDPATRAAVLYALGQRGDTAAFDAVASGLKDEDPGVRLVAISALASVGGERAVPMLVAMLPGDGTDAARALWTALLTIQGDNANAALANGLAGVAGGAEVSATRLLLLDILAERRAGEGAAAAFPLATDGDAAVRLKALQALAVVADGTYAPRLVALLPQLRTGEEPKALEDAIVASCQRIGDEQQRVAPLAPVLGAADPQLRCAALRVAGRIGAPGSVTVLVEALGDTNAEVRDTAMRSLADFPNDRPAGTLLDIAKATQNVEHYALAIRGYVRMADRKGTNEEKLSMLIQAMAAAKRTEERKLILGSMARIATAQSLTAVASHLADPELTEDAGSAAVRIARDMRGRDPDTIRQVLSQVVERVQSADTKKAANDILAGF